MVAHMFRLFLIAGLITIAWMTGGCSSETATTERHETTYDESTYGYVEPGTPQEFTHPSVPNTEALNRP